MVMACIVMAHTDMALPLGYIYGNLLSLTLSRVSIDSGQCRIQTKAAAHARLLFQDVSGHLIEL